MFILIRFVCSQLLAGEWRKPNGWLLFAQSSERLKSTGIINFVLGFPPSYLTFLTLPLDLNCQLGATVEEGPDYCVITPPEKLNITAIDTYDDHRMAMAFSLAACSDVPVTIKDPGCTRKTFPDYFEVLQRFTKHWTKLVDSNKWRKWEAYLMEMDVRFLFPLVCLVVVENVCCQ